LPVAWPIGVRVPTSQRRDGILAISTATIPVRKMPSKVPAPPIDKIGAFKPASFSKFMTSAPINAPRDPAI
jgi:hypothetical protein